MRAVDNALEFILFLFLVVFSVFGEGIKQMVDDLSAENAYTETVSHLLRISLYFHIERQDHCIPTGRESERLEEQSHKRRYFMYQSEYILWIMLQHSGSFHDVFLVDRTNVDASILRDRESI